MTTPDVDQELERLFSTAREATLPDAGAKTRIRAALAAQLATGSTGAGPSGPSAGSGSGVGLTRPAWLGIGAAVIGVCAAALWLTSAPTANVRRPAPVVAVQPKTAPAEAAVVNEPPAVVTAPAPAIASVPPPSEVPAPKVRPAPSLPATTATPSATPEDPAAELTLVRAMQQALRSGNASQALTLVEQHAQRFPRGTLAEEREGVRAVARCRLVAPADRAAILEAFSQRFGGSPYAARVKQACQ